MPKSNRWRKGDRVQFVPRTAYEEHHCYRYANQPMTIRRVVWTPWKTYVQGQFDNTYLNDKVPGGFHTFYGDALVRIETHVTKNDLKSEYEV